MEGTRREAASLVGRRLGEFVVREPLSSGGFGLVFRAEQPALAREAVIKVLHQRLLGSETVVQRFLREARLASRLDHPFAAHTYAFGAEPDGVLWIAMELVRGTPLDRMLQVQGSIPLERLVPFIERLCEVVHTAHEQGIVHRDLKPANVMVLSRAGRLLPKLLDLGIAKFGDAPAAGPGAAATTITDGGATTTDDATTTVDLQAPAGDAASARPARTEATTVVERGAPRGGTPAAPPSWSLAETQLPATGGDAALSMSGRLTQEGAVMGSPLYMAPEQWTDAAAADVRSDIYALGVLCFEALTGRPPFTGASQHEVALAHARTPPPPLGRGLPAGLDRVLARAMAKRAADRYESALDFAAAFRAASGVSADQVSVPRLDPELRRRALGALPHPLATAIAALDGARNLHQARDALWRLVRVAVRLVGLTTLAAHAHVRSDLATSQPRIGRSLRGLRERSMPDDGWLELARELTRPLADLRDAHPIPELVALLHGDGPTALDRLIELRGAVDEGSDGSEEQVRALLQRALPEVARLIGELSLFTDYPLAVPGECGAAEEWMGAAREHRASRALAGAAAPPGQPLLLDAAAAPVISLWPFVQLHPPVPGAPPALFFLEGKGRRGARLVALPDSFEHEDDELWDALGGIVGDAAGAGEEPGGEACPFPGLAAFTAEDAPFFTGRERETEAFVNRLRVTPLVALVGPSGAGKSSLLQAGVLASLGEEWRHVLVRPGPAPLVSLAAGLAAVGVDATALREEVAGHPGALGSMLRAFASRRGASVVLVIDQFEELFTLCDDDAERGLYAEALVRAARSADDPVRVVLSLRDDFLLRAEALPALRSRLGPALQLLTTPAAADLRRIVEEPVRRAGYGFDDPALPEEMVEAVLDRPGALALLSFTAGRLWELRDRRFRQLGHRAYRSLGGVGGALAQHAEATLTAMPAEEQRLVREAFRHLVTAEGTRAVLSRAELGELLGAPDQAATVVEKLVAARLLVVSEAPGGGERIEITHEALLDAWPRLVTWRREDAEGARMRDQVRAAVRQWEDRGRPRGLLWRGDALAEFRIWRGRHPGALTASEEAFAAASLGEARRERRLRQLLVAGTVVALAVVAVVLLVQNAGIERQRASAIESADKFHALLLGQYESQGRRFLLDGDPLQALAYLDEASRLGASGAAHEFLVASAIRATEGELYEVRHEGGVLRARFSPGGDLLATAGLDGFAIVWDASTGRQVARLAHEAGVTRVAWGGHQLATATRDEKVVLWDPRAGSRLHQLEVGAGIQALEYAPGGSRLAVLTMDDSLSIWDPQDGARLAVLQPPSPGGLQPDGDCAFSPDGGRIAAGDRSGAVRVWDLASGRELVRLAAHGDSISRVRFSPDGLRLVTADIGGNLAIWELGTGRPVARFAHDGEVTAAWFGPGGDRLLTASRDRSAIVWDARTGAVLATLAGHAAAINQAVWSPDGSTIATASDDATAILWDASSGRRLDRRLGQRAPLFDVAFDPAGRRMATASMDGSARVFSAEPTHRITPLAGHTRPVKSVEFAPGGAHLVTGSDDGSARIWDARTGRELLALAHGTDVLAARFDPAGARIATAGFGGLIRLWDARTGRPLLDLPTGPEAVLEIGWSPGGDRLVAALADGTARVFDAEGGALLHTLRGEGILAWAGFHPGGDRIVTSSNRGAVQVWDAASGRELARFEDAGGRLASDFEPGGDRMASATINRTARIWDLATGAVELDLVGHVGFVRTAQFSPGETFLLTASFDGSARIWDAARGDLLAVLDHGGTKLHAAAFSPEGDRVATARDDGVAEIWELPSWAGDAAALERLVRCRVPYRIQGDRLVPHPREPEACERPRRR